MTVIVIRNKRDINWTQYGFEYNVSSSPYHFRWMQCYQEMFVTSLVVIRKNELQLIFVAYTIIDETYWSILFPIKRNLIIWQSLVKRQHFSRLKRTITIYLKSWSSIELPSIHISYYFTHFVFHDEIFSSKLFNKFLARDYEMILSNETK